MTREFMESGSDFPRARNAFPRCVGQRTMHLGIIGQSPPSPHHWCPVILAVQVSPEGYGVHEELAGVDL